MLKGPSGNHFTLKAGDAQSGTLVTMWDGPRPSPGYSPKKLQGAIILGTGGDGSNGGTGTFFEGAMTSGNPPDAIDEAVQANIVAAGYGQQPQRPLPLRPRFGPRARLRARRSTPSIGTISINSGGSATGSFTADQYFSGGSTYTSTATINTSLITTNVPPAAVFQTERYGAFTYTIPNRTAGSAQTVTLYFAETYVTAAGQRLFNVTINGSSVLSSFDIYASAGGQNRAIARTFTTTANSIGPGRDRVHGPDREPQGQRHHRDRGWQPHPTPTPTSRRRP